MNPDPKPQIGISDYSSFNGNPIFFSDVLGDLVHVHVGNRAVGYTMINLYSAPEVKQGHEQVNIRVPVYRVTVSNESGKSTTFLYARYNERANIYKQNQIEDRTFDVSKDGDHFPAVVKPRWGITVLELRNPSNVNDQRGVIGMRGEKDKEERVAIQFHPLGASDGCLLAVGNQNLLKGSPARSRHSTSGTAHAAFMNTIKEYQAEDKGNGYSDGIDVNFERLHSNAYYEKEKKGNVYNTPTTTPIPLDFEIKGAPNKSCGTK
ncbi:hypothetical protein [Rurimicrobium arvi]|uniref:Uncharacterized protein n=1 Tax=Rurimicrobium arvi TaxID=2049916 RepID=A0ABP8MJ26_9BACT